MLLVTTAEEDSWNLNKKTLFLGEWCRHHSKKNIWGKMDYAVVSPYGLNSKTKKNDNQYINEIYYILLEEIRGSLNDLHSRKYSTRYWEIIIGPWLNHFIKMLLGRYRVLEKAFGDYDISEHIVLDMNEAMLSSYDHLSYMHSLQKDSYNHLLYATLINEFFNHNIKVTKKNKTYNFKSIKEDSCKKNIKHKYILPVIVKILSYFSKIINKTDAVIISSYLSGIEELKLHLYLRQLPMIWRIKSPNKSNLSSVYRKKLILNTDGLLGFEKAVRVMVKKMMPTCYLEGYKTSVIDAHKLPFPTSPKFIFTSNAFGYNELFKFWTANKVEAGTPYYVGQHGSNYGTLKASESWPEINTCSKFISWGWANVYKNKMIIRAFNLKTANQKQNYNSNGIGLLVERGPGHRDGPQDRYYEHILYQKYVFKFYKKIDAHIKNKITVRLHHSSKNLGATDDLHIWNKKYPDTIIDDYSLPLNKLIKKSRIVIFSYECSGFLECMALNVPTICFWRGGLDHLFDDAADYYSMLENVGIFTNSAEKAASHVNMYWKNIDEWWSSKPVQEARVKFCNRYSRVVKNPTKMLADMLLEDSKT